MMAIIDKDNYDNIKDALKDGAVHFTSSIIDDDYTALADCQEVIEAMAKCLGREVIVFFTYDRKTFQPLQEKLDILSQNY